MALSALDCIGQCPECDGILTPDVIRRGPFNCSYCSKLLASSAAAAISGPVLLIADKYVGEPGFRC
jgi:hypothetical protein